MTSGTSNTKVNVRLPGDTNTAKVYTPNALQVTLDKYIC